MKIEQFHDPRELRARIAVLGLVLGALLVVLTGKLYRLMIVRYGEYQTLSVENQFKYVRVRAPRGFIYDRNRELLVGARPSLDLFITPAFCPGCEPNVIPMLGELLLWDPAQLERTIQAYRNVTTRYQPFLVQVDLTRDQYDTVAAHLDQLPGVELDAVPHREYRTGTTLSHVVGFLNEVTPEELARLNSRSQERPPYAMGDFIGRRGIERAYEGELRGSDGWLREVVDARGEVMRDERGEPLGQQVSKARDGNTLILSIDSRLQAEAEKLFPGLAGAIVVMETKTGFLRAIVSRPGFDPNELTGRVSSGALDKLTKDPLRPLVFRPAANHYHPGSTFKVVTAAAALKAHSFTPTSSVYCPGGYRFGNRFWRCDKDEGHGWVNMRDAIRVSCDTYFYRVADVLGLEPIALMAREMGLGERTRFRVTAEVPGNIPDDEYYRAINPKIATKGMAMNAAIGQGDVDVTPLQLAVLYSAIANGGELLEPQVVRRVETPGGQVLNEFGPQVRRHMDVDPQTRAFLIDALTSVVNEGGTGFRARLPDIKVAGKTGTAQVAKLGAKRLKAEAMAYKTRDHAWFASFAPAQDAELTIVVLVEHSGFGGALAAPVAGALFQKYFELQAEDRAAAMQSSAPQVNSPPPMLSSDVPTVSSVQR